MVFGKYKIEFNRKNLLADFHLRDNFFSLFKVEYVAQGALDGWRVIAIVWLILAHALIYSKLITSDYVVEQILQNHAFRFILHGHFSADIYFVLSGYLIGLALISEKMKSDSINLIRFYIRRILRIFPAYLAIIICISVLVGQGILSNQYFKGSILPNIFIFNNFLPRTEMFHTNTWSLAVEEQFYLIMPLLMLLFSKNMKWPIIFFSSSIVLIMIGHGFAAAWIPITSSWSIPTIDVPEFDIYFNFFYTKPYFRFSGLFVGVLGGYISYSKIDQWFFKSNFRTIFIVLVNSLGFWALFSRMEYGSNQPNFSPFFEATYREIFSVLFLFLIFIGNNIFAIRKILSSRLIFPFFRLSYCIYLVHMPIISYTLKTNLRTYFFPDLAPSVFQIMEFSLFIFIISIFVALPFYLFVERPFTNLRARINFSERV